MTEGNTGSAAGQLGSCCSSRILNQLKPATTLTSRSIFTIEWPATRAAKSEAAFNDGRIFFSHSREYEILRIQYTEGHFFSEGPY